MKALIIILGWRGGMALWSISIEPLGKGGMLGTSSPPLHEEGAPWPCNIEAASVDTGGLVETGQKECPWEDHLH